MTYRLLVPSVMLGLLAAATFTHADTVRFGVTLTGDQEVPPVDTNAIGLATVEYDDATQTLDVNITVKGISVGEIQAGPGFHLHGPAAVGETAPVIVSFGTDFEQFGDLASLVVTDVPLSDPGTNEALLLSGLTYLNVHSPDFPTGEIRGQLVPEPASCALALLGGIGLAGLLRRKRQR